MTTIDISLILPVYNETSRLVAGLSSVIAYCEKEIKKKEKKAFASYEIIMIDDGSDIPAAQVIAHSHLKRTVLSLMNQKKFRGYRLETNQGKGRAIATGVQHARGSIIAFADIDGSVPIQTLSLAIREIQQSDMVIGSRRTTNAVIAIHQPFFREIGGRIYTFLSQLFFGLSVSDVTCGFKVYQRRVAKDMFSQMRINRWAFDTELLVMAKFRQYRVKEIPVVWSNKEGSKVRTKDMIGSFLDILKILWNVWTGVYALNEQLQENDKKKPGEFCDACGCSEFRYLFQHKTSAVQTCQQCGLTQVIPRPSQKEVAILYKDDESHFDPYIQQEHVHRRYFRRKLSQIIHAYQSKAINLLDIGCLTGILLEEAIQQGIQAEGIDISKDAVRYCVKKGLNATHGTVETFHKKHPRKQYDVITAFEIIEHAYSPRLMMTTLYAMLKKHGMVIVTTPNHGSIWRRLMGRHWPGYTHPEHLYFFDAHSIQVLLKSIGFREIEIITGDSRPFPLWYVFDRGADYFPQCAPILKGLARITKPLPLNNPINPWDDLCVVARK